ncbi:hypothetical protein AVEN_2124-1 [Araneus ventricosus]|uniref:Uncharacterized protein n=1 Tax=Araneus ventricosus TaxID=182803 RepID=A0A4Y2E9K6_ARAVE|nr:hypothetical protein AVEN_2124-1 [Araneus ventricosus]
MGMATCDHSFKFMDVPRTDQSTAWKTSVFLCESGVFPKAGPNVQNTRREWKKLHRITHSLDEASVHKKTEGRLVEDSDELKSGLRVRFLLIYSW